MMMVGKDRVFQVSPDVLFEEVGGELVLLDLNSDNYFGLNELGCRIWQLMQTNRTSTEILAVLEEEFDVSRKVLEEDFAEFTARMCKAGLLSSGEE